MTKAVERKKAAIVEVKIAVAAVASMQHQLSVCALDRDGERQRADSAEAASLLRVKAAVEEATRETRRHIDNLNLKKDLSESAAQARIEKQDAHIGKQDARIETLQRVGLEKDAHIEALKGATGSEVHTATVDAMQRHLHHPLMRREHLSRAMLQVLDSVFGDVMKMEIDASPS